MNEILLNSSKRKLRALGCFMGMAIGDALGAPIEFQELDYTRTGITYMQNNARFNMKAGQYTDDTSMGLCLADTLLMNKGFDPFDVMLRYIAWWYCGYNNAFRYDYKHKKRSVGLGGNISQSFDTFLESGINYTDCGDNHTSGNGSIMRNAPVPLAYFHNWNRALEVAHLQSKTTHQGDEASECARILTWICLKWINDPNETLENIIREYKPHTTNDSIHSLLSSSGEFDWKNPKFRYNNKRAFEEPNYIGSYSVDCLCMAMHCVNYTNTFFDALVKAVNLGGDADSLGSVVGQLAGAKYGYNEIPIQWLQSVYYWDDTMLYKAHLLYENEFS
jgi:ADP-ribosyl-[dinitrogen reductase] hydrolase